MFLATNPKSPPHMSTVMPSGDVSSEVVVRPPKKPRRFECPRCQRQFSRLEHLQRHDRTRTSVSLPLYYVLP